jgi:hypothetical protein
MLPKNVALSAYNTRLALIPKNRVPDCPGRSGAAVAANPADPGAALQAGGMVSSGAAVI